MSPQFLADVSLILSLSKAEGETPAETKEEKPKSPSLLAKLLAPFKNEKAKVDKKVKAPKSPKKEKKKEESEVRSFQALKFAPAWLIKLLQSAPAPAAEEPAKTEETPAAPATEAPAEETTEPAAEPVKETYVTRSISATCDR